MIGIWGCFFMKDQCNVYPTLGEAVVRLAHQPNNATSGQRSCGYRRNTTSFVLIALVSAVTASVVV
ncbi:MAG TPA: hypothetical protein DCS79_04260 [Gammaproteobacteria bacterium]|nr:hypothetical protein [Gammaproteobacteria bacterium]